MITNILGIVNRNNRLISLLMINTQSIIMKRMFLFGHVGITLGVTTLVNGLVSLKTSSQRNSSVLNTIGVDDRKISMTGWFESLGKFLDIRLLIIGSMLPDIIDKPLASFVNFGNGRSVSHTLLFALIFVLPGIYFYISRRWTWFLALAIGIVFHLILDLMWQTPRTLFWPYYGWIFPPKATTDVLNVWISILITDRLTEAFELAGFIIFAVFLWTLIRQRKLIPFLIKGTV